jgi:3-dehydroquinate synthase
VGRALAAALGVALLDLDADIEQVAGMPIPQIMAEQGEPSFRDLEAAALERATLGEARIIALGGGALLRPANRVLADGSGDVVFLEADPATLAERLRADTENQRPLLAGDLEERLANLLKNRAEHYASFSLRVTTKGKTPDEIVREIQREVGWFRVHGMGRAYDVVVRPGVLEHLGDYLRSGNLDGSVVVVSDENVAALYGETALCSIRDAGLDAHLIRIPAGEDYKTIDTVMKLWRGFLEHGLDRRNIVVALGGGVVGDLAGFAAATYMRGVRWVTVPTTLLSMVDASLGGKTGFDLPEGKNLVGSFHPPSLVLSDPEVLASLPADELRSGLAEVVKHGLIADPGLFDLCARGWDAVRADLAAVVRRAMAVKVEVIQVDPYEKGIRAALNMGHTVGHAIELVSKFRLKHGEAVAVGLAVEARLAERLGLATPGLSETVMDALDGLGLPFHIPANLPREEIVRAMQVDKKKAAGVVRFALPVAVGKVEHSVPVENLDLIF